MQLACLRAHPQPVLGQSLAGLPQQQQSGNYPYVPMEIIPLFSLFLGFFTAWGWVEPGVPPGCGCSKEGTACTVFAGAFGQEGG